MNESESIKEERGVWNTSGSVCCHLCKPVPASRMCQLDLGDIINLWKVCLLAGQGLVVWCALGNWFGRTGGEVSEVVADWYKLPGHAVRRDR